MSDTRICVISETGRRDVNQDRACVEPTVVAGEPGVILAVADGMGGMQAGDQAAEIAIATVREYATRGFADLPVASNGSPHALWQMFQDANARVWQWAERQGCAGDSGTTLVCCLVFGSRFVVAHTGDSRCYYVNDHEVRLLTEDHTRVQDLLRRNLMTPEAARRSPFRNELIHSLGEPHTVQVDLLPDAARLGVIDEPCVILVTSDGVHGHVTGEDIQRALRTTANVAEAGSRLVSTALAHGSTDNATVAAIECGTLRSRVLTSPHTLKIAVPAAPVTVKLPSPAATPLGTRGRGARLIAASLAALAALVVLGVAGLAATARGREIVRPWLPDAVRGWGRSAIAFVRPTVPSPAGSASAAKRPTPTTATRVQSATAAETRPEELPPPDQRPLSPPITAASPAMDGVAVKDPVEATPPALTNRNPPDAASVPGLAPAAPPRPVHTRSWDAHLAANMKADGSVQLTWRKAEEHRYGYWVEIVRDRDAAAACGEIPRTRRTSLPLRTGPFGDNSYDWRPIASGSIHFRVVSQGKVSQTCSAWATVAVPGK